METATSQSKISRIDSRFRHWAQDFPARAATAQEKERALEEREEKKWASNDVNEPLLVRELRGRPIMGRGHRMFHRQAASSNVLTVGVQVVASIDSGGNTIVQGTTTNAVGTAVSTSAVVLPSVPSVPPFPSTLTVPAYPYPSGVPSVSTGQSTSQISTSSIPISVTTSPGTSSPVPTLVPTSSRSNSTSSISSTTISSSLFSSSSTSIASTTGSSKSSASSTSASSRTSTSRTSSAQSSFTAASGSASATGADYTSAGGVGIPGGGATGTAAATPTGTNAVTGAATDDGPLGTPQVVGTVVGSLAGAAIIFAMLLFLLRRHKRKQRGTGGLQLGGGNDGGDNQPIATSGQQMATRSSMVPAGAAAFFNRFSGASRSTAATSTTGEVGFQRISGRKLPSAFSEGITSEEVARGGTLSGSSFYSDDHGFYGGPGAAAANKEFGKEIGESSAAGAIGTKERIMPSPARTPVIHHPDDAPTWGTSRNGGGASTLSPPVSPNPDRNDPRRALGRSLHSQDGSRSSKFTENV